MMNWSIMIGAAKCVGALVLSVVVLWQTAENVGPANSEVVVHVAEGRVEVFIDDLRFWIEHPLDEPIVCQLRSGRHQLRMIRSGQVLYEEEFTVERGRDKVLTACLRVN
jgi:hypothetical protein